MGQSRAESVSHNLSFIERQHVAVTSRDVDDLICLKLVCLFFVVVESPFTSSAL